MIERRRKSEESEEDDDEREKKKEKYDTSWATFGCVLEVAHHQTLAKIARSKAAREGGG